MIHVTDFTSAECDLINFFFPLPSSVRRSLPTFKQTQFWPWKATTEVSVLLFCHCKTLRLVEKSTRFQLLPEKTKYFFPPQHHQKLHITAVETSEQRGAEGHTAKKTELVESGWDRQDSEHQAEHRASAVKVSDGPIPHVGTHAAWNFTSHPSLTARRSSDAHQEPCVKEAGIIAAMKLENFGDSAVTYDITTPAGELFASTANGKVGRPFTRRFALSLLCVLSDFPWCVCVSALVFVYVL